MESEKNQTQVRAEIGWYWKSEDKCVSQSDVGAVRFNVYKSDVDDNRMEGVWHVTNSETSAGAVSSIELDYLTRKTVGGTLDIGFLDIRALLVVNHGPGTLIVKPNEASGWEGPWSSSITPKNVIPPGGAILLSAGDEPWTVTIIANALAFEAKNDKCLYDVAVVGKIGETPSSESSSSSETSNSSSSSSSESISN